MVDKIIFTTFRNNKGATGGPGGVLYLQKSIIGGSINGIECKYNFNKFTSRFLPFKTKLNKYYYHFLYSNTNNAYFFTHDIEMAAMLADLEKPYSLIFHQQGPSVLELKNFGADLSEKEIIRIKETERKAFINAKTLHFPSKGASDMYFNSPYSTCNKDEVNLVDPLYNIIPDINPQKPYDIEIEEDKSVNTLFSIGTLTEAKGQDQTINFIESFLNQSNKPVRYILVGNGPLKGKILFQLSELKNKRKDFDYLYFEALSHESVMYLHKISDIYIMLHRISIFDFATLEAMSQRSMIILSKVGGNIDFNINNNIIFAEDAMEDMSTLANVNIEEMKEKNFNIYKRYFSKDSFIKQYEVFFQKYVTK